MYEPPVQNAPFGLYVCGVDPYKQDQSRYSSSLGAAYIYKRMHNIASDQYQNMLVAQYVGRPASINEWNETVRNLIKYYNAYTLSESDDYGFIQYMINKGDAMFLMEQPEWLKVAVATHLDARHVMASSDDDPRLKSYFSKRSASVSTSRLLGCNPNPRVGQRLTTLKKLFS